MNGELEKLGNEEEFEKRLWLVHFVRVEDDEVEMREESNRVSCSSQDKRGGDGGCCFVVEGVTNTAEVAYVIVTGTRELGDLLGEGERGGSKKKPRLCADEQGRIG